jgi:hypothetical protein
LQYKVDDSTELLVVVVSIVVHFTNLLTSCEWRTFMGVHSIASSMWLCEQE